MKTGLKVVAALLALVVPPLAQAQQPAPAKGMTLVVGQAAGAGTDLVARLLAREMARELNTTVVVDNKPGANGTLAAQAVARAAADGSMLLVGSGTINAANYAFYPGKLGYEPASFEVAGVLSSSPMVLVVAMDSPWRNLADLIAEGRKQTGKLNCASGLSTSQVSCEYFAKLAAIQATTVNYRSSPQALADVAGGQVQYAFADASAAAALVAGKKLRALAVADSARNHAMPDVPTFAETGMPNMVIVGWAGVFAPAGTPKALLERFNTVLNKANQTPEFVQSRQATGGAALNFNLQQAQEFVRLEIQRWQRLHRDSGVKLEM